MAIALHWTGLRMHAQQVAAARVVVFVVVLVTCKLHALAAQPTCGSAHLLARRFQAHACHAHIKHQPFGLDDFGG